MRRAVLACFVVGVMAGAVVPGSLGRSSANDVTFVDEVGEDPLAPDITSVRVSNDDAGRIAFRIVTPNRPSLREDLRLTISLDTDFDASTGLTGLGVDARLLYDVYLHGDRMLWLLRCRESVCTSQAKIPLRYQGGPTFTVDRFDLGGTRRFRFWIAAMDGIIFDPATRTFDLANAHGDIAPNWRIGRWAYDVQIGPRRLLVTRFTTAVTGQTVVARLAVKRDDTGQPVTDGRVACRATVAGKGIRLLRSGFRRGSAECAWHVPAEAAGKTMRGSVAVTFAGKTARRAFVKKVS